MTPKEECEKVMNDLLPIGIKFLKKQRGQFCPFGAIMKMDGEITLMGFYDENEKPDPKEYLNNLKIACKKMAEDGEIKVSGIVWNASVKSDSNSGKEEDAIIVSLEHKDSYSVQIVLPYRVGLFRRYKFGSLAAMAGEHDIF